MRGAGNSTTLGTPVSRASAAGSPALDECCLPARNACRAGRGRGGGLPRPVFSGAARAVGLADRTSRGAASVDRKSVAEGKRGDLGGRRIIKKKKNRTDYTNIADPNNTRTNRWEKTEGAQTQARS